MMDMNDLNKGHAAMEPGALVVTGGGLQKDLWLNPSAWTLENQTLSTGHFSTNNHLGFYKVLKVVGYSLFDVLKTAGLNQEDAVITFISADDFTWQTTLGSLRTRVYHPHLTADVQQPAPPIIGLYVVQLYDSHEPVPLVTCKDLPLTEEDYDRQRPRIYFGQQPGNPADENQPFFVGNLVRIQVEGDRVMRLDM